MLHYYTIPPSKNLAHFVRFFWVLEGQGAVDEPFVYHSTADGCAEMIFHYKGGFIERQAQGTLKQSLSMIHAQSSCSRLFSSEESFGIFGVYLYPYALPQLFRLPCREFTNEMPGLKDLLNHAGAELEEQMMLAILPGKESSSFLLFWKSSCSNLL